MSYDQRAHVCNIKVKEQRTNLIIIKAYNYEYSHNKFYWLSLPVGFKTSQMCP